MGHLEIKHLRMLSAIAESGNMTRAAEKLCITQSALSQQLKDIENKLETDLFFRTRRKMILTEAGRQLKETAVHVLDSINLAERNIFSKVNGEKGELKVGTQCMFCYKWLPQVMKRFRTEFPNIEIEVGNSTDPSKELEQKKYDLIISGAISLNATHTSVPLFKDELVCIMSVDHPLVSCNFVQVEDFGNYNFISAADPDRSYFYQQILKPKKIEPTKIMNIGAPQAILEMVSAGFGIAIFPQWAVKEALGTREIVARPITLKGFPLTWHAVHLTHKRVPRYQWEFVRSINSLDVIESAGVLSKS